MADLPLLDVPEQLETARLLLRCPKPGDGAVVHASVMESLVALRRFPASLPWAMEEPTVSSSETFCIWSEGRYRSREAFTFLAFGRESGQHVGNVGLSDFDWQVAECEIGFLGTDELRRARLHHRGRGGIGEPGVSAGRASRVRIAGC